MITETHPPRPENCATVRERGLDLITLSLAGGLAVAIALVLAGRLLGL